MKLDKKMQGFSLIELLVVVAIIGILAAVGTVGYSNYMNSTKARVTVANAESVASGLKTLAAAANTGAGCTTWSDVVSGGNTTTLGCYSQVKKDIKKNPYDSNDTSPIVDLSAAPTAGTAVLSGTPANICGSTGLKLGQVGVYRAANFDITVAYCSQNLTTTANYDFVLLPTFNFGQ